MTRGTDFDERSAALPDLPDMLAAGMGFDSGNHAVEAH